MLPSLLNKIYSWKKRYSLSKAFYIFSLFLLTFSFPSFSQVYPVQLSTQLLPPYSGYLPDYGDPTNEKLKCILMLNDFSITHRDVKLEITITGNGYTIQTNPTFFPSPITIYPGIPEIISGVDLAPYLETQNLIFTGINVNDYEQRKVLPEGYYSICIKVIDYYQADYTVLSDASCTSAWFYLADPPFLNFPLCNSTVTPTQPQNIFFQWTPMNLSSPNSVMNTEYLFELFEIRPSSTPPNDIVLTTVPIISITTPNTFYNYGIIDPVLYTGMQYVWRVRSIDLSGRDYFKNEGYSQICTFTYGNPQSAFGEDAFTLTLNGQASTHRQIKYWWNNIANFTEYKLQIRKTGTQNWFDYLSTTSEIKISPLEPSTSYEARVMGMNDEFETNWSNVVTVTTNPFPTIVCNDQNIPINALSAQPLLVATPNMIMKIGQFEMYVTSISPFGTNPGYYSGYGYIMYYFKKIGVQFDNVYINDNLEITNGNVVALTEGVDAWVDNWILDESIDDAFHVDGTITSIYLDEDSSIVVVNDMGDTTILTFPPNDHPIVVQDDAGNQYIVYPDGTIVPGTYLEFSTDSLEATTNNQIRFEKSENQNYGFDPFQYGEWYDDYEVIQLSDETSYFIPNKSIEKNKTDVVRAKINSELYSTEVIQFKNQLGTILSHSVVNDSTFEITLPASAENYSVYAYAGVTKLGKLNVKVYEKKIEKVVLVALGDPTLPNENDVENYLNTVYKESVVQWEVSTGNTLTLSDWDENGNGKIDIDDYSLLNKYSDEMDNIRNAFNEEIDNDIYVLFIVPGFGDATVDGYMPYGRKFGFIRHNAELKTYAHELAHGAFGLQHTFPDIPQGTTNNLLDYGNGNHLATFQWNWMRENHWLDNLNNDVTEIEFAASDELSPWLVISNEDRSYSNFAFPFINGAIMKIKNVAEVSFNRYGQVYDFKLTNGKTYRSITSTQSHLFGFIDKNNYSKYAGKILTVELFEKLHDDFISNNFFLPSNAGDSVVTYARKKEGDYFINCHYVCKWKTDIGSPISKEGSWNKNFELPENKIIVSYDDIENCSIDLTAEGVHPGVGVKLYLNLYKNYPLGSDERESLADLANYFSVKVGEKRFAFYGNGLENYIHGDRFQQEVIQYFKTNNITSIDKFQQFFPFDSDFSRDFEIIFSTKNLRQDIPANYNVNSHDYAKSTEQSPVKYEYSFKDLIVREGLRGTQKMWLVVMHSEESGNAEPVAESEYYTQYNSKYGSASAMFFIAEWSARWAKDPLVAYTFYRAAVLAPAGSLSYVSSNMIKNFAIGAMIDYLMQIGIHYYFGEDDMDFSQAMAMVDYSEVAFAGATSILNTADKIQLLIQGGADCLYNGFTEYGVPNGSFDYQACGRGIIVAFLTQKISHGIITKIKQFPIERVYKGLNKIGSFSKTQLENILGWLGFHSDDIARVVGNNLDNIRWKAGWSKERVLEIPKGSRPDPSEYLEASYIEEYTNKIVQEEYTSRIVAKTAYNNYGVGKPDIGKTEYVSLKSDIDNLIESKSGDINLIADELGVPSSQLNGGLVKIEFKNSTNFKPRMPSGNEFGTNSQWLPGGRLPNGQIEAVISTDGMVKDIDYFVYDITTGEKL